MCYLHFFSYSLLNPLPVRISSSLFHQNWSCQSPTTSYTFKGQFSILTALDLLVVVAVVGHSLLETLNTFFPWLLGLHPLLVHLLSHWHLFFSEIRFLGDLISSAGF